MKAISILNQSLNNKKTVFLFNHSDQELITLILAIIKDRGFQNVEIWHCIDGLVDDGCLRHVSTRQMDDLIRLYYLYCFSDKVMVISDSCQYGSLFNYVNNGILSKEEMVEGLLFSVSQNMETISGKDTLR